MSGGSVRHKRDGLVTVEPVGDMELVQTGPRGVGATTVGGRVSVRWDSDTAVEAHPYDVSVVLEVEEGERRLVCTEMVFTRRVGGPPIETRRLRALSVPWYREYAARRLTGPSTAAGMAIGRLGMVPTKVSARVLRRRSRASSGPDVGEQVELAAQIYLESKGDYAAVVAGLQKAGATVSYDVARKRVSRARTLGLVGPAGGTTRPRL